MSKKAKLKARIAELEAQEEVAGFLRIPVADVEEAMDAMVSLPPDLGGQFLPLVRIRENYWHLPNLKRYWVTKRSEYAEYLASPTWERVRVRAVKLHGRKGCSLCPEPFTVVHHRHYGPLVMNGLASDEDLMKALAPLCADCHRDLHFTKNGRKRSVKEAEERFKTLAEKPQ